jgi:ferredoxin
MAFRPQLRRLGPDRVTLVDTAVEPRPDLKDGIGQLSMGAVVYCCGPATLIDEVTRICGSHQVRLETEHFGVAPPAVAGSEPGDEPFSVDLRRSGITVTVPAETTLLEALRGSGIDLESSSEEGYCGTCEVAVLAGAPEHRDTVLTQRQREANSCMFPCVSRGRV